MSGQERQLTVSDVCVTFRSKGHDIEACRNVSLHLDRGETLGIVGESGSGKSVLCRSILRLLPKPPTCRVAGRIDFEGREVLDLSEREMRRLRGGAIGMIFQNPMSSLNPVWPIGEQIAESISLHKGLRGRAARAAAVDLLAGVGIADPSRRIDDYPHHWSGGMLQRAVIAMAMAGDPHLLLADEPTTALDVTIQDQILELLADLRETRGMSIIIVSHDIGVVAQNCDRVAVMYAGRVVETGTTEAVLSAPRHPYTKALMDAVPEMHSRRHRLPTLKGTAPSPTERPSGCVFHPRCPIMSEDCADGDDGLAIDSNGHATACRHPGRLLEDVA